MSRGSLIRRRLYEIIFEHDTRAGRAFDVALIIAILVSVFAVMLDSVADFSARYGTWLQGIEWFFTVLFTIEYLLRLVSAPHAARYAFSFYGLIDLLAILPTYLSVIFPAGRFLITVRVVRVLRVFRVLKLVHFLGEASVLGRALRASRRKIIVFLMTVIAIVVVVGSIMYLVEGPESGFTSIPRSIYWAIVTLTTVGYGDIAPQTPLGQMLAALLMITGYGVIAVPTGIVTVELGRASGGDGAAAGAGGAASTAVAGQSPVVLCPDCARGGHDADALFCKYCGALLDESSVWTA